MARKEDLDKKKHKSCTFCIEKIDSIDYKDASKVRRYLTEAGKIIPRRITGTCAKHQRMVSATVKRAREASVISYVFD